MSYPALNPIMKQLSVFSRSLLKESQIQRSEMTTKNSLSRKWLSWTLAFNNSLESPGPIQHASWMAKLLYAINIYIFRDQRRVFNLTKKKNSDSSICEALLPFFAQKHGQRPHLLLKLQDKICHFGLI